jgi:hypothetical protein
MKPEMAAAPLEARLKARLSTANPTHACSEPSRHQPDCGEKRDPDERQWPKRNKENELDPNTQLEKPTLTGQVLDKLVWKTLRIAALRDFADLSSWRPCVRLRGMT